MKYTRLSLSYTTGVPCTAIVLVVVGPPSIGLVPLNVVPVLPVGPTVPPLLVATAPVVVVAIGIVVTKESIGVKLP